MNKIYNISEIDKDLLLAILLIDEKDNHEYFLHKYNASNKIIEMLKKFNNNLKIFMNNLLFFTI